MQRSLAVADGEGEANFGVIVVAPIAVGIEEDVFRWDGGETNPTTERQGARDACGAGGFRFLIVRKLQR